MKWIKIQNMNMILQTMKNLEINLKNFYSLERNLSNLRKQWLKKKMIKAQLLILQVVAKISLAYLI